jgi:hypothetical protein
VPHGDFSWVNHLLLPSFTAEGVANSLEENAEKSAIIERYLSRSASDPHRVSGDAQHASTWCMPESNLNVQRSRRIRMDIQGESALGEVTIEVISIAIVHCDPVIHSLSVYQDSRRNSQIKKRADSPTVIAPRHQKYRLAAAAKPPDLTAAARALTPFRRRSSKLMHLC